MTANLGGTKLLAPLQAIFNNKPEIGNNKL